MDQAPPSGTAKAALTPKLQANGRKMVAQLYMVLRTVRIHDPSNNALLVATENLKDTINGIWAACGSIRLQFVEDLVYLNDVRLRIDAGMTDQLIYLRDLFKARGLGGLAFARPVDTMALRDFMVLLARPIETEEDAGALRRQLEQMRDLALELLGPRTFAEEHDDEIKIDKKTFSLQTYAKTVVAAREAIHAFRHGRDPLAGKLHILRIIQDLVDIGTERVNFLLKVSAIKRAADYPYNHAANTCVLAIVLGKAMRIDRLDLVDLGMSAFLADLGFALLPPEVIERPEVLPEDEKAEIRDAMLRTVKGLLGDGRINDSVMRRAIVAYEHHQPYLDAATGKPRQLHTFSRIVAVADAYDALTTTRSWREGFPPDEALKMLMKEAGTRFDPVIVRILVNTLGLYPLGCVVRLDSGEVGVVYHNSNDPRMFEKPWVKVVRGADGQKVKKTLIRNLGEHRGLGGRIVATGRDTDLQDLDPAMVIAL